MTGIVTVFVIFGLVISIPASVLAMTVLRKHRWIMIVPIGLGLITLNFFFGQFLSPVFDFLGDVFFPYGQMRLWAVALLVVLVLGGALLVIFAGLKKASNTIQSFMWFFGILAFATMVIDLVSDNNSSNEIVASNCGSTEPFGTDFIANETGTLVKLKGGTFYRVRVPRGRAGDFKIRLANEPLPENPGMNFGNSVYRYASVTNTGNDVVKINTNSKLQVERWKGALGNAFECLTFQVYLKPLDS